MKPNKNYNLSYPAVIYCRVSSLKQKKVGGGLASQEARCREFARAKGYDVVEVFTDDMTGQVSARPGMSAMLAYVNKRKDQSPRVLIDDISRLARNLKAHIDLRNEIAESGGHLESPSIEFGEDADGVLVENLMASVSQHAAMKNAEQTRNRMRARLLNGYFPFQAMIGYRYQSVSGRGKMLVRDEPFASILQEGLEGFASGRFQTQAEVKQFFETFPSFPRDRYGEITYQRVRDILGRNIYAGMIEHEPWNVSLREGQHEGLISYSTFEKIQKRLKGKVPVTPTYRDISAEFPLRGALVCTECGVRMTSCWSKSSTGKKHPYYLCKGKGCSNYRKSIRREDIEGEFQSILKSLQPTKGLFDAASAIFKALWDYQAQGVSDRIKSFEKELLSLDKKMNLVMDRLIETDSAALATSYEKRIEKLEKQKLLTDEKIKNTQKPRYTYEESFERAMRFLSNPWNIWENGKLEDRRMVLKLTFPQQLFYERGLGFRTPKTALPFKVLGGNFNVKKPMAHRGRFELPTP